MMSRWSYARSKERECCVHYTLLMEERWRTGEQQVFRNLCRTDFGENAKCWLTQVPVLGRGIPVNWCHVEMETGRDWKTTVTRLWENKLLVRKRQDESWHQPFLKRENEGIRWISAWYLWWMWRFWLRTKVYCAILDTFWWKGYCTISEAQCNTAEVIGAHTEPWIV